MSKMTWQDRIKIHPAADAFPMMNDAELDELAADIRENGLRQPIVLWSEPGKVISQSEEKWRKAIAAGKAPEGLLLLDGRNRLAAIERAFPDPEAKIGIALGNFISSEQRI